MRGVVTLFGVLCCWQDAVTVILAQAAASGHRLSVPRPAASALRVASRGAVAASLCGYGTRSFTGCGSSGSSPLTRRFLPLRCRGTGQVINVGSQTAGSGGNYEPEHGTARPACEARRCRRHRAPDDKPECRSQPGNRLADVRIDQNRDDRGRWDRAVDLHSARLTTCRPAGHGPQGSTRLDRITCPHRTRSRLRAVVLGGGGACR